MLLGMLSGCVESFTGDTFDPRLPEYSESGRNRGGAYVNEQPWRSFPRFFVYGNSYDPYLRYDSLSHAYTFILPPGNLVTPSGALGAELNMRFFLSAQSLAPVIDGTAEYPLVISLDGEEGNYAELHRNFPLMPSDSSETCFSHLGMLHIRRARPVTIDNRQGFHLAATFGFDIEGTCGRYEVRSGRFDFFFLCSFEGCF